MIIADDSKALWIRSGCDGRIARFAVICMAPSSDLMNNTDREKTKVFPEIDATAATEQAQGLNAAQKNHRSTIQGHSRSKRNPIWHLILSHSYRDISRSVQRWLFLRRHHLHFHRQSTRATEDHFSWLVHHDCRCGFAMLFFFAWSIHLWKIGHWVRQRDLMSVRE